MNLNKIVELREVGYSWPDIAKKMKSTVFKVRKAWDAVLPHDTTYRSKNRDNGVTPKKIDKAIALRAQGEKWKVIARTLNVGLCCIQRAVYMTQCPKAPSPEVNKAIELRAQGMGWKEVGRAMGADHSKLSNRVWWFEATVKRQDEIRQQHLAYRPRELHQR